MGRVISFEKARRAKRAKKDLWEEEVIAHLCAAGVWPEEAFEKAANLRSKVSQETTPNDAAKAVLVQMGWGWDEPF